MVDLETWCVCQQLHKLMETKEVEQEYGEDLEDQRCATWGTCDHELKEANEVGQEHTDILEDKRCAIWGIWT